MRRSVLRQPGSPYQEVDALADAANAQGPAVRTEEERVLSLAGCCQPRPASSCTDITAASQGW
jgi:hypothetical protein